MIDRIRPVVVAAVMLVGIATVHAGKPDEDLKGTIDTVIAALNDKALDDAARWDTIRTATEKRFDVNLMGMLVLGKTNWSSFSGDQRTRYIDTFKSILLQAYSDQLEDYSDERMEFGAVQIDGSKASVDSTLVSGNRRLPVVYRLRNKGGEWLVYDVVIDGVSLLNTYQNQYNDYLKQNSIDAFLAMLQDKANQN